MFKFKFFLKCYGVTLKKITKFGSDFTELPKDFFYSRGTLPVLKVFHCERYRI